MRCLAFMVTTSVGSFWVLGISIRRRNLGMFYILKLISVILRHPDGKDKSNDMGRTLDKFSKSFIEEKLKDVYKLGIEVWWSQTSEGGTFAYGFDCEAWVGFGFWGCKELWIWMCPWESRLLSLQCRFWRWEQLGNDDASVTAVLSPLLDDASILVGIILYLINYAFGILELRKANLMEKKETNKKNWPNVAVDNFLTIIGISGFITTRCWWVWCIWMGEESNRVRVM